MLISNYKYSVMGFHPVIDELRDVDERAVSDENKKEKSGANSV